MARALLDAARWVVVGRTLPLAQAAPALVLCGLIIGYWVLVNIRRKIPNTQHSIVLLILLVVPFVLLFVFKLYRESYLKFLLVCAPPLAELMAQAIWSQVTAHGSTSSPCAVVAGHCSAGCVRGVCALAEQLGAQLLDGARDDYRGIARRIAAVEQPGDAILFDAPNQWEIFTYYHPNDKNLYPLAYAPVYKDVVAQTLDKITQNHKRLFVLYFAEKKM